jgi:3-oxoacyl-[acyl-carrier protein] reductase
MTSSLIGKTALVSGGSKGIGLEIAKKLLNMGCKVAINSRMNRENLSINEELKNFICIPGDITKSKCLDQIVLKTIQKLKKLDILICCVGSGQSFSPGKEPINEWQRMMDINFFSTTNLIGAFYPEIKKNNGKIICISSICGSEVILGAPVAYSAAKSALNAYVRGIARPFGEHGVTINAVAPGNIIFSGSSWEDKLKNDQRNVEKMLQNDVSLKRLGTTEDVSNMVAYLVSEQANFITGAIFTVDGGQVRR